ncbi:MAG TPA: hypothetical protein VFT82_01670 [Candidatus Paceibacterota bacterium]|nr:hypothetical protein [Candidatus Paceibacterota bacterium]
MFENESVISVGGNLYVKNQAALDPLIAELNKVGYKVDNLRESEHRKERNVSVEDMEKNGWSMWYAHLDIRKGKCHSCKQHISTTAIQCHGHACEKCGAVTYYDIIDGTTIRFSFIQRTDDGRSMADITMVAQRWDTENGYLYLYPEVRDGLFARGEGAKKYFEANKDKWTEVDEGGKKLIRIRYPNPWNYNVADINPSEIRGHYWNHEIVDVWEGKEYSEWASDFPLPKSFSIYETWHWSPLPVSPTLHKHVLSAIGNTDDKGWHYQDGRPWFNERMFEEMGKFIRHFTTLDAHAWDEAWPRFRRDGPGGIDDIARFCHKNAHVENRPNIGNVLVGCSKIAHGTRLTENEMAALADGLKNKEIATDFNEVIKTSGNR